jgi:hypothetical protein
VIILDHNIAQDQVDQLHRWKIHYKQIGFQVGRPEWLALSTPSCIQNQSKRCGKVVRLSPLKIAWWEKARAGRQYLIW